MDAKSDFIESTLTEKQLQALQTKALATGIDYQKLVQLATASVYEARDKEQRLRTFYQDQEVTKDWIVPTPSLDYLRQFKPEGKTRKNGVKQSILHELDAALWAARLYQAGLIPEKITYEVIDGQRHDIPEEHQSTQYIQSTTTTHDTFEEFAGAARAGLIAHLRQHAPHPQSMSNEFREAMIQHQGDATDAITFDMKMFDENQNVYRQSKYRNDDRQPYSDVMIQIWSAIGTKGPDRMGGNIMRFDQIPDVFTYDQQLNYLEETEDLFMLRQILEKMQERYPELEDFFSITNANLSIAMRIFKGALKLHSDNPNYEENVKKDIRIDIDTKILDEAFRGAEFIERDIAPMQALLENYQALAERKPIFNKYVGQIETMLKPYLSRHPEKAPNYDRVKQLQPIPT